MNLETEKKNTAGEQEFLSTKNGDVAVIKSIVEYSNTLKNRCIEYMDTPESDFSYDQLAEMVKAYRIYSRSCGEIVTLIYEFYDYEEVDSCTKTVNITKDNFSAHINAAKAAVAQRLDACHERYSKTFFSEDEVECNKILRRTRAERRTLEELMRLFGRLAKSFEVYFDSIYDEYSYIDDYVNTNGAFSPEDYYYDGEEAPAEYSEEAPEPVEAEYEAVNVKTSTLEDILAEYAAEEDYENYYTEGESDDIGEEVTESSYESINTEETVEDIPEPEEEITEDIFENDGAAEEPVEDDSESTEITEEISEEIPEPEEAEKETVENNTEITEGTSEEIPEPEEAEETAEDTFEDNGAEDDHAEDTHESTEAEESAETSSEHTEEAEKYNFEHIESAKEVEEKNSADEKFIDFIENGKFEFLKAVFEENGDIRRESHITTVAESDFTRLPLKNVWDDYRYITDIHNIYKQYTSISSDDTEIRRGIIRASAVKRIADFLESVGIEPSAENIMQLDRLCPIEFSAPDAAVIDTDSTYILSVFKAVYDYLNGDRSAPIAVSVPKRQEAQESFAEEKFFGFGSGDDYEDYETSKYIAADYEAAAREFDDENHGSGENEPVQNTPADNQADEQADEPIEADSFDSAVPERASYEEEQVSEPTAEADSPVKMIFNGKETVYESWAEAERALCEYAIKAKPFAMALINRRSDTLNGQKLFNRATYETPNTISLSNGLQVYKAASREDFTEICGRVLNICSIDRDIYKIIESGV